MFRLYDGYHFLGMHLLWWAFWFSFSLFIFGWFEQVPRSERERMSGRNPGARPAESGE